MTNVKTILLRTALLAGIAAAGFWPAPASAADEVLFTGTIKSASGEKLEGVPVSARLPGKTITTTVYTDADGAYYFPAMEPGKYKVWAQAVGFQDGIVSVDLKGEVTRKNFTLGTRKDMEIQFRGDEWMMSMPERTPQDRKMKMVFRTTCMGCHPPSVAFKDKFDEKGWRNIITTMSRISTLGSPVNHGDMDDTQANPVMEYFKNELAAYLARARGPEPSPDFHPTPRPRMTGEETRVLVREYDAPQAGTGLPLFDDGSLWSEGAPSKLDFKNHHAVDGTIDADGNVYVADDANLNPYRTIAKIDQKTGLVTNIKVDRRDGSGMAASNHDVITSRDGTVWFGTEGRLYGYDPKTAKLAAYTPPAGVRPGDFLAIDGQDGIWSPGNRFDPKTKAWRTFRYPTEKSDEFMTSTYGVGADADGNGWLSQYGFEQMIHMNPKTGVAQNIKLPKRTVPDYETLFQGNDRKIYEMAGGPLWQGRGTPYAHGVRKPSGGPGPTDSLWAPSWYGDSLLKINIRTMEIKEYPAPLKYGDCYQTLVDQDGMVWTVFTDGDYITKFDPKTEKWTRYDLPTIGTEAHGIQIFTVNGRTELTAPYFAAGKTAKMQFRTQEEVDALKLAVNGKR